MERIKKRRECDCENCILGWEDRGFEDCDAGCHYYPDLWWNGLICYMPNFIKKILLNKRIKQEEKSWEGYTEYIQEQGRKADAMREAIESVLLKDGNMICYTGLDGKIYPYDQEMYLYNNAWDIASKYEELLEKKEGVENV